MIRVHGQLLLPPVLLTGGVFLPKSHCATGSKSTGLVCCQFSLLARASALQTCCSFLQGTGSRAHPLAVGNREVGAQWGGNPCRAPSPQEEAAGLESVPGQSSSSHPFRTLQGIALNYGGQETPRIAGFLVHTSETSNWTGSLHAATTAPLNSAPDGVRSGLYFQLQCLRLDKPRSAPVLYLV